MGRQANQQNSIGMDINSRKCQMCIDLICIVKRFAQATLLLIIIFFSLFTQALPVVDDPPHSLSYFRKNLSERLALRLLRFYLPYFRFDYNFFCLLFVFEFSLSLSRWQKMKSNLCNSRPKSDFWAMNKKFSIGLSYRCILLFSNQTFSLGVQILCHEWCLTHAV